MALKAIDTKTHISGQRTTELEQVKSEINSNPSFLTRTLLVFVSEREVLGPDRRVYTYKRLGGRNYYFTRTNCKAITSLAEYDEAFGIDRRK